MVFKNIYFQTIARILAIFLVMLILAFIFGDSKFFFTQIILGIVIALQVVELIRFYDKTNKELARFLFGLKESDFTLSFIAKGRNRFESELYAAFNEVVHSFSVLKTENEASYQFLKEIINGLNIGLIVLGPKENIELINNEALRVLNIPEVKSWKHLKGKNIKLIDEINKIKQFGTHLIEQSDDSGKKLLSLTYNEIIILEKPYRFVLFKNIRSEIESKEIQAWHKLIRILTHEIMNSMTPLASLSDSLKSMIDQNFNEEIKNDLYEGLDTISDRSKGLLHFVNDYRKLSKVQEPKYMEIKVSSLMRKLPQLFKAEIEKAKVDVSIDLSKDFILIADESLIEQVLINLFKNSLQAMDSSVSKKINLSATFTEPQQVINITDTGCGVPKEKLNEIFVPFFSTKEGGSGIGLSLSQQIMNKHNGRIEVVSNKHETTFSLIFSK